VQRILIIRDDPRAAPGLEESLQLTHCSVEFAEGDADALQRLRLSAFEVVLTSPRSTIKEDISLITEIERIRPGLRTIVLAPEATPEDVIAALRARVFACFSSPFELAEVANMAERALQADDWRSCIEVLSAQPNWIELRVTCQMLTAERLLRFMTELRSDLRDPDRTNLLTAFREILMNAMEHGAGFDPEKVVEVSAIQTERAIVYHFRDPGPGFRGKELPHAASSNSPENPLGHVEYRMAQGMRPGGFGILLAQHLVDELIFNETGNEALLIKHTA
jgi:anti-sigma regulatory factor (Ser/Thr protein kinase)/ActR/RegA family two-component response regulator